ncbi:MAG: four helix bundle protein [bacterium]|nr:four helix bundle protein [bacterium]
MKHFDLLDRTAKFGEAVIDFALIIPKNAVTTPLIVQFVKAGTSIGANYCEADSAESRKDFEHKMGISKKEAKECMYWLKMIARACPALEEKSKSLWNEADELHRIFLTSIKTSRSKQH